MIFCHALLINSLIISPRNDNRTTGGKIFCPGCKSRNILTPYSDLQVAKHCRDGTVAAKYAENLALVAEANERLLTIEKTIKVGGAGQRIQQLEHRRLKIRMTFSPSQVKQCPECGHGPVFKTGCNDSRCGLF